jgi:hypothetical protein
MKKIHVNQKVAASVRGANPAGHLSMDNARNRNVSQNMAQALSHI